MIRFLSEAFIQFLHDLGEIWLFFVQILRTLAKTRGNFQPTLAQIASISTRSLPIIIFSGIFVGAILVLQFNLILAKYDAQILLGGVNTSSVVREVGPLIISFLLAGKIGAYTAAELGTMRVTEQIDAIECLGINPIQYLIIPRFLGIIFSSVILLIMGLIISIGGAMCVASFQCGINFLEFSSSIPQFTSTETIIQGMLKSFIYAVIVAGVCCQKGFYAKGGAKGVGNAVTSAAVCINLYIVIANYLSSYFLLSMDVIIQTLMKGHP